MAKFNDLLHLRFRQKEAKEPKITALVEKANNGDLSSFSGVFRVSPLSEKEKETIVSILEEHRQSEFYDIQSDLLSLSTLTSEVKAISNQAIILHGERIKKAQELLKKYQEGAFTAWLYATYGNRQTPYNFLQYYEFYLQMPVSIHSIIDQMPRQAIYTLASRDGDQEKKEEIVRSYQGEAKQDLLKKIRHIFPLAEDDKRGPNLSLQAFQLLKKAKESLKSKSCKVSLEEKASFEKLLEEIQQILAMKKS